MAKCAKKTDRLNIYLDSEIRRKIRIKAAQEEVSISEYCRRVLTAHLSGKGKERALRLKQAVENARLFQSRILGGKAFQVSSADLIRESREGR